MSSNPLKSRFHHVPMYFSKLLFILYKVPLYIRCSTLAYTVNTCTPALWLRLTGLSWRRVSGQLTRGVSLMPRPGSTGKLQAPRGTSQVSCVVRRAPCRAPCLDAEQLHSLGQHGSLPNYLEQKSCTWEKIIGLRQDVSKHSDASSQGRTED